MLTENIASRGTGGGTSHLRNQSRRPRFPANREKYREFARIRHFLALLEGVSWSSTNRPLLHVNSLRQQTGNFGSHNRGERICSDQGMEDPELRNPERRKGRGYHERGRPGAAFGVAVGANRRRQPAQIQFWAPLSGTSIRMVPSCLDVMSSSPSRVWLMKRSARVILAPIFRSMSSCSDTFTRLPLASRS